MDDRTRYEAIKSRLRAMGEGTAQQVHDSMEPSPYSVREVERTRVKRIVICCDGTWNRPDQVHNGKTCASNVTKIARCVAQADAQGVQQLMYYDRGVGTGRFD